MSLETKQLKAEPVNGDPMATYIQPNSLIHRTARQEKNRGKPPFFAKSLGLLFKGLYWGYVGIANVLLFIAQVLESGLRRLAYEE